MNNLTEITIITTIQICWFRDWINCNVSNLNDSNKNFGFGCGGKPRLCVLFQIYMLNLQSV